MAEVSLKVLIAGRTYPLTIKQEDEQAVQFAAKLINEKVKEFEQNYSVRDKQDLLAMSCLQFATAVVNNEGKFQSEEKGLEKRLLEMDQLLTDCLGKNNEQA